jgi:hypothetical protein
LLLLLDAGVWFRACFFFHLPLASIVDSLLF